MRIGTILMGNIHSYNKQYIATKFFTLGVPLFPVASYFFVTPERGIEMDKVHGKSVLKGYLSFATLVFGLLALLRVLGSPTIGMILLGISVYFFWFFGKPTEAEKKERDLFEKATGMNALPSFLDKGTARTLRNNIVQQFRLFDPNATAETLIPMTVNKKYDKQALPLVFAFMAYHNQTLEDGKFDHLVNQLKQEYIRELGLATGNPIISNR